jgi:hypothetical protein
MSIVGLITILTVSRPLRDATRPRGNCARLRPLTYVFYGQAWWLGSYFVVFGDLQVWLTLLQLVGQMNCGTQCSSSVEKDSPGPYVKHEVQQPQCLKPAQVAHVPSPGFHRSDFAH